jgi:hypothetical protein
MGTHSITASYSGDANFTVSTSSALSQVVSQASTTSSLGASVSSVTVGQPVIFTTNVTGQNGGTPTGSVTFKAASITLGTATLTGGQAALTYTFQSTGTRSITAIYSGDANFIGSTSPVLSEVVSKGTTSTSLSSNVNPSVFGQAVTFTATVTGGVPNGELVTFKNGASTLGTAALAGGVATFTTSTLAVGTRSIKATYSGDSKLLASTSNAVSQVIQKSTTTATIASSVNPSSFGQAVTFTVTLSGQFGGTPTGSVTFTDNGATLGTATVSGGVATLTTSSLTKQPHVIKGTYAGDSSFKSTSKSLQQIVH